MSRRGMSDQTRRTLLAAPTLAAALGLARGSTALAAARPTPPRADYGFTPGLTYLNTASLGPTPRPIRDLMDEAWNELETNPVYETYGDGPLNLRADAARAQLAALLGCAADDLLVTRSTTDAMNTLALGMRLGPGDRVLTTDQEHEGAVYGWDHLARHGVAVDVIPIGPKDLDPAAIVRRFEAACTPATRVISVSQVITTTGHLMPVAEIAALARARGIFCAVDGAQALGQLPVDVKAIGCQAYAAPGHKWLMGPKGTGFLYLSPDALDRAQPVQLEAGHRFISNSAGTGCLPLAIGLGAAAEALRQRGPANVRARVLALRRQAYEGLAAIPGLTPESAEDGAMITAMVAFHLPPAIDANDLRQALRLKHQVIIKKVEPRWFNGIRLSPHIFNDEADVDRALWAIRREAVGG
ncbi:MAG: aminotransferase class V-fold PLP-dependent enzyme [Caulobacter sp.]|nr:aminotransferase class V-fold PLP-dependent enzyme [Caulobacter sp.]